MIVVDEIKQKNKDKIGNSNTNSTFFKENLLIICHGTIGNFILQDMRKYTVKN
jgi:hypothetical protein